jgi:hypothetical protein
LPHWRFGFLADSTDSQPVCADSGWQEVQVGASGGDHDSVKGNPGQGQQDRAIHRRSSTVRIKPKSFTLLSAASAAVGAAPAGGREIADSGLC